MKDRRSVDDLSVEEIQRVLAEKKRAAREARLDHYRRTGRALPTVPPRDGVESDQPDLRPAARPRSLGRRLFDAFLLVVEIAAVLGLVYVLYNGTTLLAELNRAASEALQQNVQGVPTIAPTPIVSAVVLPSGHTPPTAPGGAQPNLEEIPANLRPIVQAMPPPIVPTQGPTQALRIIIPSLDTDAPIVQGDGWEQLKKGVGQHIGTPDPGVPGKMVLSAHNDIYGEIFRHLDRLVPGDEIQIYTAGQIFTYLVSATRIVAPTEVSVMQPTENPSLILVSCYPYLVDTERIVVFADLKTQ